MRRHCSASFGSWATSCTILESPRAAARDGQRERRKRRGRASAVQCPGEHSVLSQLGRANASHGLYGEPVRLQFGMASAKYLKDLLAAPSRRIGDHATPADVVAARLSEVRARIASEFDHGCTRHPTPDSTRQHPTPDNPTTRQDPTARQLRTHVLNMTRPDRTRQDPTPDTPTVPRQHPTTARQDPTTRQPGLNSEPQRGASAGQRGGERSSGRPAAGRERRLNGLRSHKKAR